MTFTPEQLTLNNAICMARLFGFKHWEAALRVELQKSLRPELFFGQSYTIIRHDMKTIVYFEDGSIEATACADAIVARGDARYATENEIASYERALARDEARITACDVS